MTENQLTNIVSDDSSAMGPLERSSAATNAIVLQLGLLAEMTQVKAEGNMTPELEEQFTTVFAATQEAAEA